MKPCPFCGESNAIVCDTEYGNGGQSYAVSCRTRDCHGVIFKLGYGLFDTKEKAIKAWNHREKGKGKHD
jgi:Lar family restriction alleviation protein